ncbi:hypothetical protein P7D85_17465 [Enterococcus hulanensis]|uniref:Uncharacterized protein n=1 Tax=Enterococcus hulanensis TaxID=2559929 RepID=A0ABU3F356_9ENTE|nr:hypothetical protein [Enterococcus hulanensis]MDT2601570.1 hypothetical protein [Enterococcus hulanensis]MDT2609288.1 hypothetical protein [Enterococcus hulanensis]MDT2616671.1 hypothetical protein [Enterococcus hulanensis]MDT2629618.1 hypothetical protein [Enterococcus hulanensis]MDT2657067.1 hypothetical protein [Enterococcus hulanensis]
MERIFAGSGYNGTFDGMRKSMGSFRLAADDDCNDHNATADKAMIRFAGGGNKRQPKKTR